MLCRCQRHVPTTAFPIEEMYHGSRMRRQGNHSHVHHFFLPRALRQWALLVGERRKAQPDAAFAELLLFFVEQAFGGYRF
jgi:hypothetical protein